MVWSDLYAADTSPRVDGAGCYMPLTVGEKVVNAATSIGGYSFFGTNRPAPLGGNTCSANLGVAKSYAMPMFCVASAGSVLIGGGLRPARCRASSSSTRATAPRARCRSSSERRIRATRPSRVRASTPASTCRAAAPAGIGKWNC
ncbi:MAG: hypothetical protein MZW92_27890 [Comamonadaceae bacterium]|nr:hypothetical protein [Comamonadaceae bacterium]